MGIVKTTYIMAQYPIAQNAAVTFSAFLDLDTLTDLQRAESTNYTDGYAINMRYEQGTDFFLASPQTVPATTHETVGVCIKGTDASDASAPITAHSCASITMKWVYWTYSWTWWNGTSNDSSSTIQTVNNDSSFN